MRHGRPPPFHYTRCGLDDVWLANGWRVKDTEYGRGFAIENADRLHRAIASAVASGPRPLRGQEARFLRVMLNLSQADMARLLGVDRATVIRWEKARKKPLSRMQDIALRATYAARVDEAALLPNAIAGLQEAGGRRHGPDRRAVFRTSKREWRESKAA